MSGSQSLCKGTASETIRIKKRREAQDERLHHRQLAVNLTRKNYKEIEDKVIISDKVTLEELMAAVNKIKLGYQTSHLDLRALKQILFDSQNVSTFLRITGSLHAVVGHLTVRRALHQLEAAYICCNLATGDQFACETVTFAAGPYLIEYLHGQNTSLQVACLWTVGNLAGGCLKSFKVLKSQGLVDSLTNCLTSSHPEVIDATLYALCLVMKLAISASLEFCTEQRQKIASLVLTFTICKESVDWLLYLLSCKTDCDEIFLENMVPKRCIDSLAKLSQNAPFQVDDILELRSITALVRTAGNLCSEESGRAASMILTHSSFPMVLNDLLHSKHQHVRKEAEWFGMNILRHPCHVIVEGTKSMSLDKVLSAKDQDHINIHQLLDGL